MTDRQWITEMVPVQCTMATRPHTFILNLYISNVDASFMEAGYQRRYVADLVREDLHISSLGNNTDLNLSTVYFFCSMMRLKKTSIEHDRSRRTYLRHKAPNSWHCIFFLNLETHGSSVNLVICVYTQQFLVISTINSAIPQVLQHCFVQRSPLFRMYHRL